MSYISNYIIKKIKNDAYNSNISGEQGKLLLINYDENIVMQILEYFNNNYLSEENIILILDNRYSIEILPQNAIDATYEKMAQYRNKNIKNSEKNNRIDINDQSYLVFITKEVIDTFNDIYSLTYDDLKNEFSDIIQITPFKKITKEKLVKVITCLIKEVPELNIIELEAFLISILNYMNNEGYPLDEAMGLSLPQLGGFKYQGAFAVLKGKSNKDNYIQKNIKKAIDNYKKVKNALHKRVGNKTISNEDLNQKYEENQEEFDVIGEIKKKKVLEFISAKVKKITELKSKFMDLDWNREYIYKLFEKAKSNTKTPLGKETIEVIKEDDITLDKQYENILLQYDSLKPKQRNSLIDSMYHIYSEHKLSISKDSSLAKKWDKLLYPSQVKSDNFIIGILESIKKIEKNQNITKITISLNKSQPAAIMNNYNKSAIDYLGKRYSILNSLSTLIHFDFEFIQKIEKRLSHKPKDKREEKLIKDYKKHSASKKKNDLNFLITVYQGSQEVEKIKFVWQFNPNSLLIGFKYDIERVIDHINKSNLYSNILFRSINSEKGEKKALSILDSSSLESSGSRASYKLFPKTINKEYSSIKNILSNAKEFLNEKEFSEFSEIIQRYLNKYKELLISLDINNNLSKNIFDFEIIKKLSQKYGEVSRFLMRYSDNDNFKQRVIEPFLSLVTLRISDEKVVLIPSYHPLRLISYFVKIKHTFEFLDKYLLSKVNIISKDLFFADLIQNFRTVYYPEIFRLFDDNSSDNLLYISESYHDYTILESLNHLKYEQTINPTLQTKILSKIIKNYLELYPHKHNSLKIVLHAVKNHNFPIKLMKQLVSLKLSSYENNIEIYLNDADAEYIRKMYRTFLINSEEILEFNELSFLSNIRLNAFDNDFRQLEEINDQVNITFLNDFVSTKAEFSFTPQLLKNSYNLFEYHPTMWSKRKYITNKENGVGLYLVSPAKTELTENFYNLLYSTMSNISDEYKNKIPTLIINRGTKSLNNLNIIHDKSDWVVTLDSLLDKKIVKDFGANVIKYRKARHINRNLIISSKANINLLKYRLKNNIADFFEVTGKNLDHLLKETIISMNHLSGDILLKAIGQGRYTNELLGLVLTKAIITSSSEYDNVSIYIDDYADWFLASLKVEEDLLTFTNNALSDILSITPIFKDGKLNSIYLDIIESKFCGKANKGELAKKSLLQTKATYNLIKKIFQGDNYFDKNYWIAKISDLIVETCNQEFKNGMNSEQIRNEIRFNYNIKFIIRGISYVFVYDFDEDEFLDIDQNIYQYVIGKKTIQYIFKNLPKVKLDLLGLGFPKYNGSLGNSNDYNMDIQENTLNEVTIEEKIIPIKTEETECLKKKEEQKEEFKVVENSIRKVVTQHGYRAKIKDHLFTPNSLRVSLKAEIGWKPRIFYDMRNDFLTVEELELLRVEPVKGAYDLIFKREKREIINYEDCLENRELSDSTGNTKILIGRNEENNKIVYYNLDSEDPHALVGGMTKSGKSVLLNIFIIDLIRTNSIDELKLILVDPKQVEFTRYKNLKYLDQDGIITNQEIAIRKLNELVDEMELRYQLFTDNEVNNIKKYNHKMNDKLPRIVVIFDEFADWMLDDEFKKSASNAIQRLSGKARAAGIHLIIATQRPDNNVVPTILRANLGAKFALRVDSDKNSKIILGEEGAENLLGYGHMITKFAGQKIYLQTAFISDEYIEEIINKITNK